MRAKAYLEHIRCIEACTDLKPEARQLLLDSAKRQLHDALRPQEQRAVFAVHLLQQRCPRDLIPARIMTAFGVQKSTAYQDLDAGYSLFHFFWKAPADTETIEKSEQ
jgi:hypothetical protein